VYIGLVGLSLAAPAIVGRVGGRLLGRVLGRGVLRGLNRQAARSLARRGLNRGPQVMQRNAPQITRNSTRTLEQLIDEAPSALRSGPRNKGVYIGRGSKGEPVYVGSSKDFPGRQRAHGSRLRLDPQTPQVFTKRMAEALEQVAKEGLSRRYTLQNIKNAYNPLLREWPAVRAWADEVWRILGKDNLLL
jgi:hypothetical protein